MAEKDLLRLRVEKLVEEFSSRQAQLGGQAIQLGRALLQVRNHKLWKDWGYDSFGKYIDFLKEKSDKGRTSLHGYIAIADKLLPYVSEIELTAMGVSKAGELKKAVVASGKAPSADIIRIGTRSDVKLDEFKAAVAEEFHVRFPNDKGKWWSTGFYLSDDERKEVETGLEVAAKIDPTIPIDLPDWARAKEAVLRWVREFNGTYEQAVKRGEA